MNSKDDTGILWKSRVWRAPHSKILGKLDKAVEIIRTCQAFLSKLHPWVYKDCKITTITVSHWP